MTEGLGHTLKMQRQRLPHYAVRRTLAEDLGITIVHLAAVEDGAAYPSGQLLEKWLSLLEFSKQTSAQLWKQLALHQLDLTVARHVTVAARRSR